MLQNEHEDWVGVWERGDLRGWKRVLLTAQRIWKKVERTCQTNREELARLVSRSTTKHGRELWNPHHYQLDAFLRKDPQPAPSRSRLRNPNPPQAEKRLYEEMARTYEDLEGNMGALRQISIKKMKKW